MSRRIFFTFLSILVSLPFLVLIPTKVFGQTYGAYGVSGYVCDDLNANGRCEPNEPGVPGMMVYADNTTSYKAYTDAYGYWQIPVLPAGAHSIEIANAGAGGSRPTTSEKFLVSGPTSAVQFGVQKGGYGVDGYVRDPYGRPVVGTTVYVDLPNRETAVTNGQGYYRFEDIGYDSSTPQYGVSGGHNVYVEGYNANPVLVNPQTTTPGIRADMTVTTDQGGYYCGPAYARDPNNTFNCAYFPSRCSLPAGWQEVGSCNTSTQPGGQCTPGQRVPSSGTQTCNYQSQQRCMVYSYYNSSSCSSTYQGGLEECQYIAGYCGYQPGASQPGAGQCTQGQQIGASQTGCFGQQYCTNVTTRYNSNCTTYQDYQGCQYISGQCGYSTYSTYSNDAYLQGQQNFQDLTPVVILAPPPATWTESSWQVQPSQPSYSIAPYVQQTWYDQSTPYIAPDQPWY